MHEFESLLFSEVKAFSQEIPLPETSMGVLVSIHSEFKTPEAINDSRQTAPSKRIIAIIPKYQKRVNGPRIALAIGLDKIRAECPRNDRLDRIDRLIDWPKVAAILDGVHAASEGRPAYPPITMVKIIVFQQWHDPPTWAWRRRSKTGCRSGGSRSSR